MQTEWSVSKHQLTEGVTPVEDLVAEENAERQRWGEWAKNAAVIRKLSKQIFLKRLVDLGA